MSSTSRTFVAQTMIKRALNSQEVLAGGSGLFGPLGAAAYGTAADMSDDDRAALIGRSAVGASIGGLLGSAAGIPLSMATGVPILPGMAASMALGSVGGGIGAAYGRRKHDKKKRKKDTK
jgi:membrane associated rhomboid family serine protease